MKFREVTWYSKLLALALFVALPFIGFWSGMRYQEAISIRSTNNDTTISTPTKKDASDSSKKKNDKDSGVDSRTVVKKINNDKLSITVILDDSKLSYNGAVRVPSPCYNVKHDALVPESSPEQVQIRIFTEKAVLYPEPDPTSGICAQVVTNKEFSGEIQVSSKATISIYLDGKLID